MYGEAEVEVELRDEEVAAAENVDVAKVRAGGGRCRADEEMEDQLRGLVSRGIR